MVRGDTIHGDRRNFPAATPFWSGAEEWKQGLKLRQDFAGKLPAAAPLFLYHCKDDEEVPFSQFEQYKTKLIQASFRAMATGGHLLNDQLGVVAEDIKALYI